MQSTRFFNQVQSRPQIQVIGIAQYDFGVDVVFELTLMDCLYRARRSDGHVDVVNRCRTTEGETEARGVARIVDEHTFAKLKVRFAPAWLSWLPMVWGDYWIIGLAPDYSWAVVGDPSRNYLWILARTSRLDDQTLAAARALARASGYDVERLELTPHAVAGQ